MNLSPDMEDQLNRIEALEAIRTSKMLTLQQCNHPEHYDATLMEIAAVLMASIALTEGLLADIRTLRCDAVEWPGEIPAN